MKGDICPKCGNTAYLDSDVCPYCQTPLPRKAAAARSFILVVALISVIVLAAIFALIFLRGVKPPVQHVATPSETYLDLRKTIAEQNPAKIRPFLASGVNDELKTDADV